MATTGNGVESNGGNGTGQTTTGPSLQGSGSGQGSTSGKSDRSDAEKGTKRDLRMLLNAHEFLEKDQNAANKLRRRGDSKAPKSDDVQPNTTIPAVGSPGTARPARSPHRKAHRCEAMEINRLTAPSSPRMNSTTRTEDAQTGQRGSTGSSGNEADADTNSWESSEGEAHARRRHKSRPAITAAATDGVIVPRARQQRWR